MHGQIDSILNHFPSGSHNLVVTGRLVADTSGDLTTPVKEIKATLTINGGREVDCNTNIDAYGKPIKASNAPGTPWVMQASTPDCGAATGTADAFNNNNVSVAHWEQPPTEPTIVVH